MIDRRRKQRRLQGSGEIRTVRPCGNEPLRARAERDKAILSLWLFKGFGTTTLLDAPLSDASAGVSARPISWARSAA